MTSHKQAASNRRNSRLSTGPKTIDGKLRSAMNALTHGLLARQAVNPTIDTPEDCAEFAHLNARNRAWYQPVGPIEELLVDKIAIATWRLRKAMRYEAVSSLISFRNEQPDGFAAICSAFEIGGHKTLSNEVNERKRLMEKAGLNLPILPSADTLALLLRYEASANRDLYRAMSELRRVRKEGPDREAWTEPPDSAPPASEPAPSAASAPACAADTQNCQTKPVAESAPQSHEVSDSPQPPRPSTSITEVIESLQPSHSRSSP